ncbi:MAG TPA: TonB dependent receptor [bacterium]|nr:TonB dependent receptor [bacterium]
MRANRAFPHLLPLIFHFSFLIINCPAGFAQSRAAVTGTVLDASAQPVAFATVTLHRAADSLVVKSEFTDERGAFQVEGPAGTACRLSVAQVGFQRHWSAPFELPATGLALPAITLQPHQATNLREVTVVGQKPLFERFADRTVVNVEGSTIAAGNTALDVLGRSPGVTVDNNDNLALRGRQGVLVLMDGKRVPMSGAELANLLRSLPAEQVKNIELITNPSAKYEAQGSAGIIAINLRKDQRLGTNATLNGSYGRGRYNKFNGGLSFNHRRQKINFFGSYSYTDREGFNRLTIHRDFFRGQGPERAFIGSSDQENYVRPHFLTHSWKAGLDYNLTPKTLVGLALNGQDTRIPQTGSNSSQVYDAAGHRLSAYRSANEQTQRLPNWAANLNLRHTFRTDSSGTRELTADLDYARYSLYRDQALTTTVESNPESPVLLRGDQEGHLSIQSFKADYAQPLPHGIRFETGLKTSYVTADNDVVFTRTQDQVSRVDVNQTNHFRYTENINAGYVNLSGALPGWTLQGGLRVEQTNATGRQRIGNDRFDRHYYQLFPSAAIQRKLSDNHELGFSLSRRIDRPSYQQLNPFRSYIDSTTYGSGNKDLLPQTSYNLELSYTLKQKYGATLGYSRTANPIIGVVQPIADTSRVVVSREVNLGTQHYYNLSFTIPADLAPWWSIYANTVAYYNHFQGTIVGSSLDKGRASFNANVTSSFKLGHGWTADLIGMYQAPERYGFFSIRPIADLAVGIQKVAWQGRGTFKLNVTDVFYTNRMRATSAYDNFVERFHQRRDSRVATLSFSYRLGNQKLAPSRRRQGGAEDEKRRAG